MAAMTGSYDKRGPVGEVTRSMSDEDVIIAVLGVTGSGKSTFISEFARENVKVGHSLESCTTEVQFYSFPREGGRTGYLIDTPGFDDTSRSDTEILKDIAFFFNQLYRNGKRLTGLIYLHRITDVRMQGSTIKNLEMFQRLCGRECFPNVALVTTMWQTLGRSVESQRIGEDREHTLRSNDKFWGVMEKSGSRVMRHYGDKKSVADVLYWMVNRKSNKIVLDIQRQMVDQGCSLDETTAGKYLQEEFVKLRIKYEKEMEELQRSLAEARQDRDTAAEGLIASQRNEVEEKIAAISDDTHDLQVNLEELEAEKRPEYDVILKDMELQQGPSHAALVARALENQRESERLREALESLQVELDQREKEHNQEVAALKRQHNAKSEDEKRGLLGALHSQHEEERARMQKRKAELRAREARDEKEREQMERLSHGHSPAFEFLKMMIQTPGVIYRSLERSLDPSPESTPRRGLTWDSSRNRR